MYLLTIYMLIQTYTITKMYFVYYNYLILINYRDVKILAETILNKIDISPVEVGHSIKQVMGSKPILVK